MAIMGLVGAGVSAMGAMAQGQAQSDAYKRQAEEYQTQAQLDQRQAAATQITGQYKQRRAKEQADDLAAKQVTGYAAGGVTLSGSPTTTIIDSRRENSLDIAALKYNTDLESDNQMYKSRVDSINADSAFKAADTAQQTAALSALTGLIGGIGKIADSGGGLTSLGGGF